MPQETLSFPPLYCIVGAYRLAHDDRLWRPMWKECSQAAKRAGMVAGGWALITWPVQKLFVYYFMRGSAKVTGMSALYQTVTSNADKIDGSRDSRVLGFGLPSLTTFAAMIFVLGQCHTIMEFWLLKKLRKFRNTAYESTVQSRGKPQEWWTPYFEEWDNPPVERAMQNSKKQKLYIRLASPFIRRFILRVALLPLDFIPFLGLFVSAALRSLSMGRELHSLLFAVKKMTPLQVEIWLTERQWEYRSFGFVAALLESIPLFGIIFSVSNRVGAAMYAHDLEKRQQLVRSGKVKRLSKSETESKEPRIPFLPQDDGVNIPGGVFSNAGSSSFDEPPAYTVSEATELIGGSGGPGGKLGMASPHQHDLKKRNVPPPPLPERK